MLSSTSVKEQHERPKAADIRSGVFSVFFPNPKHRFMPVSEIFYINCRRIVLLTIENLNKIMNKGKNKNQMR